MAHVNASIGKEHYRTEISTKNNRIISDEPVSAGGEDLGFSPEELLAASLSACTCATLRMYADRKGWSGLTGVAVEVTFTKMPGQSAIERTVKLEGDLTDEQRQRLLEIANRCPMHQALTHPVSITTTLSPADII